MNTVNSDRLARRPARVATSCAALLLRFTTGGYLDIRGCVRPQFRYLAAALLFLTLVGAGELSAAALDAIPSLFGTPAVGDAAALSVRHAPGRAVRRWRQAIGRVDLLVSPAGSARVVAGQRISLNLFDDTSFTATITEVTRHPAGGHTWSARLDGVDFGFAVLAVQDGAVVGSVFMPGGVYRIGYAADGSQVIEQIDQLALPAEVDPVVPPPEAVAQSELPEMAADSGSQIDVMVVYTAAARAAAGGTAAMQAEVSAAVALANQAYANNGLVQRLRLVYTGEVSITESESFGTDLTVLTSNSTVASLRNSNGADLVSLLTSNGANPPSCGIAWLMTTLSSSFASLAFSVVDRLCAAANLTFPHELGHNMGAAHDPYAGGPGLFAYSHGYVNLVGRVRTIMAYPDQCFASGFSCTRIPYFSTPGLTPNGQAIGTASTSDNSRTLSQTADTVANFRQAVDAQVLTPAPGSVLPGAAVTFTWSAGSGVSQYWLDTGTTPAGIDLYHQSQGTNLSGTVSGLPTDGRTLYVRLWSLIGGVWHFNDYTYFAFGAATCAPPTKSVLQTPTPGTVLAGATVTFTWSKGCQVAEYWLDVGTTPGGSDLLHQSQGTNLSGTVGGLPTTGQTVYVRLWSRFTGVWQQFNDYTYTACSSGCGSAGGSPKAQLLTPAPGTVLPGATVTFTWSAGSGVAEYWLDVGTTPGGSNLLHQSQGTNLSGTVSGLPTIGQPVYVRLWSRFTGVWQQFNDYTYTAFGATCTPPTKADMQTPAPGSTLAGATVTFTWSKGCQVAEFWLDVGTTPGGSDLLHQSQGMNLSGTVGGLPATGQPVYVRLWSFIAGAWQFNDYTYTAATAVTSQTLPVRLTIVAPPEAADFGSQIVFIGDLNGEAVRDLAIFGTSTRVGATTAQGRVYIVDGASGVLLPALDRPDLVPHRQPFLRKDRTGRRGRQSGFGDCA